LLSKRQITGLITGIIQESSALSTAKIASRVGVSANCALVHLRRMEEYGSVEHNGDLWNSPGMMDVVEQSNDKVSSDEIC
jgi:predicted ArsR family transcriptional regulator